MLCSVMSPMSLTVNNYIILHTFHFSCIGFFLFRYNIFTGCPHAKTCTLILRGGAEQFIEETERSLHDAIMIVRRTIKNDAIVAGM